MLHLVESAHEPEPAHAPDLVLGQELCFEGEGERLLQLGRRLFSGAVAAGQADLRQFAHNAFVEDLVTRAALDMSARDRQHLLQVLGIARDLVLAADIKRELFDA